MLLMEISKCCKITKFPKTSIKMKYYQTFHEVQTASALRKLFNPPPDKSFLHLWRKKFLQKLTGIHRHRLSKCLKNAALRRKEMVQYLFFLTPTRNMFSVKFVKWVRFLAVFVEYTFYNIEWVKVCKMGEVFRAKLYCKMIDLLS